MTDLSMRVWRPLVASALALVLISACDDGGGDGPAPDSTVGEGGAGGG